MLGPSAGGDLIQFSCGNAVPVIMPAVSSPPEKKNEQHRYPKPLPAVPDIPTHPHKRAPDDDPKLVR